MREERKEKKEKGDRREEKEQGTAIEAAATAAGCQPFTSSCAA